MTVEAIVVAGANDT